MTEPITRAGAILGTLYYMAPEQVEGKETDERSDIFSFGVVFYEMITGQRPFTGDTQAAVLASLLKDQPPPMSQRQPAQCREQLERVVRKCLEKKPDDRWHSARDLKPTLELIDLDAPPASAPASTSVPIPVQTPRKDVGYGPHSPRSLLVDRCAAGAAVELWLKPSAPTRATRFEVTLPENVNFSEYVSVSPDGHKLVFNATGAQSGLWIRDLDTLQWRQLPGTEGVRLALLVPGQPVSRVFGVGNELKKIEVAGGPPQTLCTSPNPVGTGAWSKDNVIVFGGVPQRARCVAFRPRAGSLPNVTVVGRKARRKLHLIPTFLPDGKHFVYLIDGSTRMFTESTSVPWTPSPPNNPRNAFWTPTSVLPMWTGTYSSCARAP